MTGSSATDGTGRPARRPAERPRQGPLVVMGDALLDVDVDGEAGRLCPDAPVPVVQERAVHERPGGAGLAAYLAARSAPSREVVLVTALGDDRTSAVLRGLLEPYVTLVELPLDAPPPRKTRVRAGGQPLLRLDRGGGGTVGKGDRCHSGGGAGHGATARARDAADDLPETGLRDLLATAAAVLVSDYGQGLAAHGRLRELLQDRSGRAPFVWDPHPRGAAPVPGAALATPSLSEARSVTGLGERDALRAAEECGRRLARRWKSTSVAVTLGERGAMLSLGDGAPLFAPSPPVADSAGRDSCGAGDRFAGAVAEALAEGGLPSEAVLAAVEEAAEFVAAGGASAAYERGEPAARGGTYRRGSAGASKASVAGSETPAGVDGTEDAAGDAAGGAVGSAAGSAAAGGEAAASRRAADVVARTRANGGTVVATGGCFDVLHAGHVATLRIARSLGDCLVVCLNSDESVRAAKGSSRPLNSVADREAVLRSLAPVDAVEIFDEPTPEAVLRRLRPDVWVKGGDYGGSELPESPQLAEWGGQTVVVPYVPGRSTTRIADAATETARASGPRQRSR